MSDLIYHTVLVVEKEGVLVIEDLPLKKGQRIEVAVYGAEAIEQDAEDPLVLRGEPIYDKEMMSFIKCPVCGGDTVEKRRGRL